LLAIGAISAQASQLEVLQALNLVRADPTIAATWIKNKYISNNRLGITGDENCYQEAVNFLMTAPKVQLISEDAGLDIAAYNHAQDQVTNNIFRHTMSDNTDPSARVQKFGRFTGAWSLSQFVAQFQRSTAVPANDVITLFLTDCGVPSRKHRASLLSNTYSFAGVGVYNKERTTIFTLLMANGFVRAPITNAQLDAAMIQGNGMYSGTGSSFATATFKKFGDFVHPGSQIHTQVFIENIDDSTGPLGNLMDDKSVACPTQINSDVLESTTVRAWTKTSQTCSQGKGAFTTPDNLDRARPFAQKGKCYQRLSYCGASGAVYVYDRQYKTQQDLAQPPADIINELGDAQTDATVACPTWISAKLRIRVVNNWYMPSNQTCTRGSNGYDNTTGLLRKDPFAKRGRCYYRAIFCNTEGKAWYKDSEYMTYSAWAALKTK